MGACLSSTAHDSITTIHRSTSAFVISINGELRHYPTPIFVSELLQFENPSSVSSFFVCNSDNLYYDQHITGMHPEDDLDAGQIYFILPKTMLGRRLAASDMAALAVKASVALDSNAAGSQKRKNKARISPLMAMETSHVNVVVEEEVGNKNYKQYLNGSSLRVSRSGSIRKFPRNSSSRKGRSGVGSFRLRLSTIYENEGCDELQMIK